MGYFVAMEHICYDIGPINVCTNFEINRYKFDEFRKQAKIVFYLTSLDAKTTPGTVVFLCFGDLDL